MKLVERDETIEVKTMTWLIYGDGGLGKTSLASMVKGSILLDFDNGIKRTGYRGLSIPYSWEEYANNPGLLIPKIKDYDVIIIDALSTMMGQMKELLQNTRSDLKNPMQLYGEVGNQTVNFLSKIRSIGKSIILVTHEDYDENTGRTSYAVEGKATRKTVSPALDYATRIVIKKNLRTLQFSAENSEEYFLKNSGGFPKEMVIQDFGRDPEFSTKLFANMLSKLGVSRFENKEKTAYMKSQKATIEACTTADELNEVMEALKTDKSSLPFELSKTDASMLFEVMKATATKNKVNYNEQERRFE